MSESTFQRWVDEKMENFKLKDQIVELENKVKMLTYQSDRYLEMCDKWADEKMINFQLLAQLGKRSDEKFENMRLKKVIEDLVDKNIKRREKREKKIDELNDYIIRMNEKYNTNVQLLEY